MTLEEFGGTLRGEREKKGISLEDVSNHLKISVRMLKALEEGDRENFPHIAYAKGFLRSYATYLGLSQDEISEVFSSIASFSGDVTFVAMSENQRRGQLISPLLVQVAAIAIILALVGGFAYLVWNNGWASSAYNWILEKSQSFKKGGDGNHKDSQKIAPLSSSLDEDSLLPKNSGRSQERSGDSALHQDGDSTRKDSASFQGGTNDQSRTDSSLPLTDSHQVVMIATEDCWVHSTADRVDTRQFSLRKGDTFALAFRDRLEIKLGNAGGVRFRYNGQEISPLGKPGQVKTVLFPLEANE